MPKGLQEMELNLTFNLRNSVSIFGLIFSKLVLGGMTPFSNTRTALMTPARPLAPSRWPMLDLRAPLNPVQRLEAYRKTLVLLTRKGGLLWSDISEKLSQLPELRGGPRLVYQFHELRNIGYVPWIIQPYDMFPESSSLVPCDSAG